MDTTPLERDLLQHRDFLLRLAAGLVGTTDAEDLVQDVWTKALEHPRAAPGVARGWLARVARNLAVNRFRARARRESRERAHAPREDASTSVAAASEHFELTHQIAAAVRTLDEPYRAVILLRFFEGLEHAVIAARLGLPLATVRTRQQRALVKLRERLDRECGGREAWGLALGSWIARKGLPVASTGSGLAAGTAAAVVLALAGAVGWLWLARTSEGRKTFVVSGAALPAAAMAASTLAVATDEPADERQMLSSAALGAPRHMLVGRAVGLTSAECAEAHIKVDAEWPYAIDPPPVRGGLLPDGSFELPVDELLRFAEQWSNAGPPREFVVLLDHPVHLRLSARVPFVRGVSDEAGDCRFDVGDLAPVDAAVLRGSLCAPDGAPMAGAAVEAFPLEGSVPREHSAGKTVCDAEGRFDLRLEQGGEFAVAFLAVGMRPAHVVGSVALGEAHDLAPVALASGQSIAGRALRLGQPMPFAKVDLQRPHGRRPVQRQGLPSVAWVDDHFEWERMIVTGDEAGAFHFGGLAETEYELRVTASTRWNGVMSMPWEQSARVLAPSRDVLLEFRASLVTLERSSDSPQEVQGHIRVFRTGEEVASFGFWRASDGTQATFVAPPETVLSLSVEFEGATPIPLEIVTPAPGEELRLTVAFAAPPQDAVLELELVRDARLEIDAVRVYFEGPDGSARFDRSFAGEELPESGLLRLQELPPGFQRLRIHAGWDHPSLTPAFDRRLDVELLSGETTRARVEFELGGLLRVDVRDPSGARKRAQFRLLDAAGVQVPITFHARRDNGTMSGTWYLTPWSANESETLAVGAYELVLWDDDLAEERLPVRIVAGETTDVVVTLQPK